MEQQSQSLSEQQKKSLHKTTEKTTEQPLCCPNCGTPCQNGDKFCEECGMTLKGTSCPKCAAASQLNWEICPHCGQSLHAELCSFCGSPLGAEDAFCPDCGNPRTGILCPDCGIVNFRSFCRKCNRPLNEMGLMEMQQAKKDPVFQQMLSLAQELAKLEEQLLSNSAETTPENGAETPPIELSDSDKSLIQQYKDLLACVRSPQTTPAPADTPKKKAEAVQTRPKIQLSIQPVNLEEAKQSYKSKLEEMQRLMDKLLPPGDMTPQMQRNYYSARKLPVIRKTVTTAPAYWVCNLCGCEHNHPSECAQPELGGTWVYKDVVTIIKTFEYQK